MLWVVISLCLYCVLKKVVLYSSIKSLHYAPVPCGDLFLGIILGILFLYDQYIPITALLKFN